MRLEAESLDTLSEMRTQQVQRLTEIRGQLGPITDRLSAQGWQEERQRRSALKRELAERERDLAALNAEIRARNRTAFSEQNQNLYRVAHAAFYYLRGEAALEDVRLAVRLLRSAGWQPKPWLKDDADPVAAKPCGLCGRAVSEHSEAEAMDHGLIDEPARRGADSSADAEGA